MTETTDTEAPSGPLMPAPKDVAEDVATGYAVYDTSEGRFVGGVTSDKPSAAEARKAVRKGHTHAIVRV